jgi:hypothetical protein
MPQAYFNNFGLSLTAIERPGCPRCQTRMSLARIAPGPKGVDICTFECGKCEHAQTLRVETDPMKSAKAGWLYSELKAPT